MNREEKIMKRMYEHWDFLEKNNYEIVYLALCGSQNYNLDYENSDIDTKAVVLPNFEDIVFNRDPISTTLILENNEHIDVKDVRIMFNTYQKQNTNYIETLFTDFKIVNPEYKFIVKELFDNAEEIAHINFNQTLKCIAGMSMEKLKALKHPYPTIVDKIEKFGYDPKQLHHILRLNDFIKKYGVEQLPYKNCLVPNNPEKLIEIKKGILSEEEATKLAHKYDNDTNRIKNKLLKKNININQKGIDILNNVKYNLLRYKIKKDIKD